jgi:uncharacterized protein (TIGR01777 family)
VKIVVSGASGLMGTALVPHLREEGHEVVRLVRRRAAASDEVSWDPKHGDLDTASLTGIDAVINLAGAGIGDHRWTEDYKREILQSRVQGTDTLTRTMAEMDPKPSVFVGGNAIGYYGDTGEVEVDEAAAKGVGFASDVVAAAEAAAEPARDAGIRVVSARSGLIVAPRGGAWGRMMPLFKLGLGGRLGSGQQWWSTISLPDQVVALSWLISHPELGGPVNLTAPEPIRNADMTKTMGRLLHRPTLFAVPEFALRTALGGFSSEVLRSTKVAPRKLLESGFTFKHPTFAEAFASAI